MEALFFFAVPTLAAMLLLRSLFRRARTRSIGYLPGPPPSSWLVGDMPTLLRPKVIAGADFAWTRDYGNILRFKGTFGRDILFTSDPKALQYILNTAGYNFPRPEDIRAGVTLIIGKGIGWAEGSQHARQRKIMNPAFSYSALRGFLPLFRNISRQTVSKLKENIYLTGGGSVDILSWMTRTTLDAIGEAVFDYQFKAIEEENNALTKPFQNLFADAFFERSDFMIVLESLWGFIPQSLVALATKFPTKQLQKLKEYRRASHNIAKDIVSRQSKLYDQGKEGSKDVMSILVRANLSENSKTRLSEEEVLSQLATLILAGHESTSSTITWALYELSRHQELQTCVREEIKATRARASERGTSELSISDLDSMKLLLAVIKETLRFHPILPALVREAGRDDLIPLDTAQKSKTGKTITSVPISKGQRVILSIAAYNRIKSVWGEDADEWRPERFLEGIDKTQKTNLGVFSNIATFSSGLRGCIGWRFAVIEMQVILVEMLENFEFKPPAGGIEIIRGAAAVMTPMIKGSNPRRIELPLKVIPL